METEQDWYFTFMSGVDKPHRNCYTVRSGTFEVARQKMFTDYGDKWCMQYSTSELAGVEKFNLKEI